VQISTINGEWGWGYGEKRWEWSGYVFNWSVQPTKNMNTVG